MRGSEQHFRLTVGPIRLWLLICCLGWDCCAGQPASASRGSLPVHSIFDPSCFKTRSWSPEHDQDELCQAGSGTRRCQQPLQAGLSFIPQEVTVQD